MRDIPSEFVENSKLWVFALIDRQKALILLQSRFDGRVRGQFCGIGTYWFVMSQVSIEYQQNLPSKSSVND